MSKMPPVPPEHRSNKGPGSDPKLEKDENIPGREEFRHARSAGKHQAEHHQPGLQRAIAEHVPTFDKAGW
jgi:hypothetical protein